MKYSKRLLQALSFAAMIAAATWVGSILSAKEEKKEEPMIGHMVFFSLNESTPEARAKLVEACDKYLSGHEGTVLYSAGVLCDSLDRPVNDRDWDVGLHLVFKNMDAHNQYQDHARHIQFIEENKASWKKVRVFDSECATAWTPSK